MSPIVFIAFLRFRDAIAHVFEAFEVYSSFDMVSLQDTSHDFIARNVIVKYGKNLELCELNILPLEEKIRNLYDSAIVNERGLSELNNLHH